MRTSSHISEARLLRFSGGESPSVPEAPRPEQTPEALLLKDKSDAFKREADSLTAALDAFRLQAQSDAVSTKVARVQDAVQQKMENMRSADARFTEAINGRLTEAMTVIRQAEQAYSVEEDRRANPLGFRTLNVQGYSYGRSLQVPAGTPVQFQFQNYTNRDQLTGNTVGTQNRDRYVSKQTVPSDEVLPGGGRRMVDVYVVAANAPYSVFAGGTEYSISTAERPFRGGNKVFVADATRDALAGAAAARAADAPNPVAPLTPRGGADAPGATPPENPFAALETQRDEAEARVGTLIDGISARPDLANRTIVVDGQTFNMAQLLREIARHRTQRGQERASGNAALYTERLTADVQWLGQVEAALTALTGGPTPREANPEVSEEQLETAFRDMQGAERTSVQARERFDAFALGGPDARAAARSSGERYLLALALESDVIAANLPTLRRGTSPERRAQVAAVVDRIGVIEAERMRVNRAIASPDGTPEAAEATPESRAQELIRLIDDPVSDVIAQAGLDGLPAAVEALNARIADLLANDARFQGRDVSLDVIDITLDSRLAPAGVRMRRGVAVIEGAGADPASPRPRSTPETAPETAFDASPIRPGESRSIPLAANVAVTADNPTSAKIETLGTAAGDKIESAGWTIERTATGIRISVAADAAPGEPIRLTAGASSYEIGIVDLVAERAETERAYDEAFAQVRPLAERVRDQVQAGDRANAEGTMRMLRALPVFSLQIPEAYRDNILKTTIVMNFRAGDHDWRLQVDNDAEGDFLQATLRDLTQEVTDAAERAAEARREFIAAARGFNGRINALVGLASGSNADSPEFRAAVAALTPESDPFLRLPKPEGLTDADWAGLNLNRPRFFTLDGHECEITYDARLHQFRFTDKAAEAAREVADRERVMRETLTAVTAQAASVLNTIKTYDGPADGLDARLAEAYAADLQGLEPMIGSITWPDGVDQAALIRQALADARPVRMDKVPFRASLVPGEGGTVRINVVELGVADLTIERAREQGRKVDALVRGIDEARWVVDGPRGTFRLNGITPANYAVYRDRLAAEIGAERALLAEVRRAPGLTDLQRADAYDVRMNRLNIIERKYVQLGEGRDANVDTREELREAANNIYTSIVAEIADGKTPGQVRDMIVRLNDVFDTFPNVNIAAEVRQELLNVSPSLAGPGGRRYAWRLDGSNLVLEATPETKRAAVREAIDANAPAKALGEAAEREADLALALLARDQAALEAINPLFSGENIITMTESMRQLRAVARLEDAALVERAFSAEAPATAYTDAITAIQTAFDRDYPGIRALLDTAPTSPAGIPTDGNVRVVGGKAYRFVQGYEGNPSLWVSGNETMTPEQMDAAPAPRVVSFLERALATRAIEEARPVEYRFSTDARFDLEVPVDNGLRGNAGERLAGALYPRGGDFVPYTRFRVKLNADGTVGAAELKPEGLNRPIVPDRAMRRIFDAAASAARGKTPKQAYEAVIDALSAGLNDAVTVVTEAPAIRANAPFKLRMESGNQLAVTGNGVTAVWNGRAAFVDLNGVRVSVTRDRATGELLLQANRAGDYSFATRKGSRTGPTTNVTVLP